jgi:hypothetical protein
MTIRKAGKILLGVEVTERSVNTDRVTMVFDQKVSPSSLDDYMFLSTALPTDGALTAARSYTAVGHEMKLCAGGTLAHS